MKKIIIVLFCAFCFGQCKKESDVWMTYQMTQCADPWMDGNGDYFNNKEAVLKKYLENQGITVNSLAIDLICADAIACAACTCTSCYRASVLVPTESVAKMEALKFVKKI
jgi:hypothetical protein